MTDYALLSAEELAAMTRAERAAYYMALYQQAGTIAVGLIPNDEITLPMADELPGEGGVYSAASNLAEALLDALAALTEMVEVPA